jgi:hypothetical protein
LLRIAGLPACLGRDPSAEVPMRDPGVSRRHALIRSVPDSSGTPGGHGIHVEDAGSRGGVLIGGARLDRPLPLRGTGEIALGMSSPLRFVADEWCVSFEGLRGLDRALRALVGVEPIALSRVFPEADGLSVEFSSGCARLVRRPDVAVRVGGHFIGPGCDLLSGDVIELAAEPSFRLEVE